MTTNEIIILALLVAGSVGLIIYALMPRNKETEENVLRRMSGKRGQAGEDPNSPTDGASRSTARQMIEKVAPIAMKPVMPKSDEEMSSLKQKLSQAGFRNDLATRYFLASKTIAGLGLAAMGLLFAWTWGFDGKMLFGIASFVGGTGFMLPNLWLGLARKKRTEKIGYGLPDSLDLLVVSVEAGLGLDAALLRVSDEMRNVHSELSQELQIATVETQMGVPRAEALQHMADRCGVDEMRSVVAVITQAEKFGTSVARALRTQADTLRVKRRLKAEERAQKTAVKLMLPLIFFIFPSIFVVLLGPAVMRIADTLKEGGPLS